MIDDLPLSLILKLIKIFNSIENLYNISKNEKLFYEMLYKEDVILSKEIFKKLINFNLKEKCIKIYNNLVTQNIKIISIFSEYCPKELLNLPNAPIVFFVYGDISYLETSKRKVYLYYNEYMDILAKGMYKKFKNMLEISKNISVITTENTNQDIVFKTVDLLNEDYINSLDFTCNKLYILLDKSKKINYEYMLCAAIINLVIIVQADFDKKLCNLVNLALDFGKDVCVVPWSIYTKKARLSNELIRDGAICISSFDDFNYILSKLNQ